jgi:catechol 2,3-dioxygenase-like lactoylglutathione lyase family enzyme
MTANRDFKRIVRARAHKTGESYAAARRSLRATDETREDTHAMKLNHAVPIMRIFEADKAKEFYVEYLGMTVDWEHRFEPGFPLYLQVSRGDLVLHLSEHHGDGTPGTTVYVQTEAIATLHAELDAKHDLRQRPGLETSEIGTRLTVVDPFGNTIRFNERPPT